MDETIPTSDSSGRRKGVARHRTALQQADTPTPAMPATAASSTGASTGQQGSAELTTGAPANGGSTAEGDFVGRVRERANAQITTQKERATDGLGLSHRLCAGARKSSAAG